MVKRTRILICFAYIIGVTAIGLMASALLRQTREGSVSGFPVCINEIMSSNSAYYDCFENAYDWIELYNSSNLEINLSQYKITDNDRTVRYIFPDGAVIPARGYYVIWCNSKEADDAYASFGISKAGNETICLLNGRNVRVDRVVTLPLEENSAMARDENGNWRVHAFGTPGYANSETGYQEYLHARQSEDSVIIINEVMVSNQSHLDAYLAASDWIELYNTSDKDVDISGFHLTDRLDKNGYIFPDGSVIGAHQYLVVHCDSTSNDAYYAPFSLVRSGGETIILTTGNVVLDQVVTQTAEPDTSLARYANDIWQISELPTPGYENSEEGYARYRAAIGNAGMDVRITEIMASNRSCLRDADGDFSDWIELANFGSSPARLEGYYLSDRNARPCKWALPDIVLEPGERMLVFASGKDAVINGEYHANFLLNHHQGVVTLCAAGDPVLSKISYADLGDDISYCMNEATEEWWFTPHPSPGYPNNDIGYDAYQASREIPGSLTINEVMTGNWDLLREGKEGYFDWVEVKNMSNMPLDLSKYSLTDNLNKTERCALPKKILKPGDCAVFLCTGDTPLARSYYAQIALSLNAIGDRIYLLDEAGAVLDYMTLQGIPYGGSYGRMLNVAGHFYFSKPTPGKDNGSGYRLVSEPPTSSTAPGIYNGVSSITVSLFADGDIYYTMDGSDPSTKSARYTGPIQIDHTTVIRVSAVKQGRMISPPLTLNYFLNVEHTLPIVAVTTDEKNLYGSLGILTAKHLFDREVVRPAHVAFYSDDGSFSAECGLKLHGYTSRLLSRKKSYKVVFRPRYGLSQLTLDFPLFSDRETTCFDSFLIRSGKQDNTSTHIRDELLSKLAIRSTKEMLVQDTRFCVYYLNGEYQGLYCIKEAFSPGFFAEKFAVTKDSVEQGMDEAYDQFTRFVDSIQNLDLQKDENFRYVEAYVNIESLIDWCIYEAYSANTDLKPNFKIFRSPEYDNNRWHYALFDLDYGFNRPATFSFVLNSSCPGCRLLRFLLANEEFCDLFLRRLAYQLENYLMDENVIQCYTTLQEEIRGEIPRERERWDLGATASWEFHMDKLEQYLRSGRCEQLKLSIALAMHIPLSQVESYFSNQGCTPLIDQ